MDSVHLKSSSLLWAKNLGRMTWKKFHHASIPAKRGICSATKRRRKGKFLSQPSRGLVVLVVVRQTRDSRQNSEPCPNNEILQTGESSLKGELPGKKRTFSPGLQLNWTEGPAARLEVWTDRGERAERELI